MVRLPSAVLHDVGIGDPERVRYAYVVMPQVVEAEVRASAVFYSVDEPVGDLVGLAVHKRSFDRPELFHEEVRHIDISVRICGFGHLRHPETVFISDNCFADQQPVADNILISQSADLTSAQGAERGEHNRAAELRFLGLIQVLEQFLNFFVSWSIELRFLLLRQCHLKISFPKHITGSIKKVIYILYGLWCAGFRKAGHPGLHIFVIDLAQEQRADHGKVTVFILRIGLDRRRGQNVLLCSQITLQ